MTTKRKKYELYYTLNKSTTLPKKADKLMIEKSAQLTHEQKEAIILLIYEYCQINEKDITNYLTQNGNHTEVNMKEIPLSLKKILSKFVLDICAKPEL
jgi:hypothetical protein